MQYSTAVKGGGQQREVEGVEEKLKRAKGRGRALELISAPHVWTAPHRRPTADAAARKRSWAISGINTSSSARGRWFTAVNT